MDGDDGDRQVRMELEKINRRGNGRITINQTLYDVGHGTIFVLQIVNNHHYMLFLPSIFLILNEMFDKFGRSRVKAIATARIGKSGSIVCRAMFVLVK